MVKTENRTVVIVTFPVKVTQPDIDGGECRLANQCMVRIATIRAISEEFPQRGTATIKVRCDAGHIWATFNGHRWIGDMPREAKTALINFDHKKPVRPFTFKCRLRQLGKVNARPFTTERREQINAARREREMVTGIKDHRRYRTLRKRIIGFA